MIAVHQSGAEETLAGVASSQSSALTDRFGVHEKNAFVPEPFLSQYFCPGVTCQPGPKERSHRVSGLHGQAGEPAQWQEESARIFK